MIVWPWDRLEQRVTAFGRQLGDQITAVKVRIDVRASQIENRINLLGVLMSELDASVDDLTGVVSDVLDAIDPSALEAALAEVSRLNEEIASAAQADDEEDAAYETRIADLQTRLDEALSDAQENAGRIREQSERLRDAITADEEPDSPLPTGDNAPA